MADELQTLRDAGWSVAVHNDYRLNGEPHTFWLWTHPNGRWVKGEGRTDAEALTQCVSALSPPPPSSEAVAWRPEVRAFADLMEAQLKANDHKGGWKECKPVELWKRIGEESHELFLEIYLTRSIEMPLRADPDRVGREAADVANFAMMVADVCGALPHPDPCSECGGSGNERWLGATGEEVGPCSACQPQTFPCPICGGLDDERQFSCEACGGAGLLGNPEGGGDCLASPPALAERGGDHE